MYPSANIYSGWWKSEFQVKVTFKIWSRLSVNQSLAPSSTACCWKRKYKQGQIYESSHLVHQILKVILVTDYRSTKKSLQYSNLNSIMYFYVLKEIKRNRRHLHKGFSLSPFFKKNWVYDQFINKHMKLITKYLSETARHKKCHRAR